jgi:hypothetical protein
VGRASREQGVVRLEVRMEVGWSCKMASVIREQLRGGEGGGGRCTWAKGCCSSASFVSAEGATSDEPSAQEATTTADPRKGFFTRRREELRTRWEFSPYANRGKSTEEESEPRLCAGMATVVPQGRLRPRPLGTDCGAKRVGCRWSRSSQRSRRPRGGLAGGSAPASPDA